MGDTKRKPLRGGTFRRLASLGRIEGAQSAAFLLNYEDSIPISLRTSSFWNQPIPIGRLVKPIEEWFLAVSDQHELEVLAASGPAFSLGSRSGEQPVPLRSASASCTESPAVPRKSIWRMAIGGACLTRPLVDRLTVTSASPEQRDSTEETLSLCVLIDR